MSTQVSNYLKASSSYQQGGNVDNSTYARQWKHLCAGGLAAVISRTLTAPLDRLKTMAQAQGTTIHIVDGVKMMVREGGFFSMWRGNGTNLIKAVPEVSTKFLFYNELKCIFIAEGKDELGIKERLFAGGLSGMLSHSLFHPLEVCKTRLVLRKTGENHSLIQTGLRGFQHDGFPFFYRGYFTSLIGILIFSSIDLTAYESLKKFWHNKHGTISSKEQIISSGIGASVIAQVIAYPFAVLGVHLQITGKRVGITDMIKFVKNRGVKGMYRGIATALLKGVPTYTATYFVYEEVLSFLGEEMV